MFLGPEYSNTVIMKAKFELGVVIKCLDLQINKQSRRVQSPLLGQSLLFFKKRLLLFLFA